MPNIQKGVKTYAGLKMHTECRFIVNGQYEKSVNPDELNLIRFMLGGIDSK